MGGLKPTIIGILLGGLFALALISGGIMLAERNNANQSIGDDPVLSSYKDNLEVSLLAVESDANGSLEALGSSPTTESGGAFIYDATTGVWKTLKEQPSTNYNLLVGVTKNRIFGETFNPLFAVGAAILITIIIFGVIKLVISGQDE